MAQNERMAYPGTLVILAGGGPAPDEFRSRFACVVEHEPPPLVLTPCP